MAQVIAAVGIPWYFGFFAADEFLAIEFGTNGACFGQLVNQTEPEIRERHGEPKGEWQGYRPLGDQIPQRLPEGKIRTLQFRGIGGLNRVEGIIVVWLVERRRGWVCFDSVWFAGNVIFP